MKKKHVEKHVSFSKRYSEAHLVLKLRNNTATHYKLFINHNNNYGSQTHVQKETLSCNLTQKLSLNPKTSVSKHQDETSAVHKPNPNHTKLHCLTTAVCIRVTEYH